MVDRARRDGYDQGFRHAQLLVSGTMAEQVIRIGNLESRVRALMDRISANETVGMDDVPGAG